MDSLYQDFGLYATQPSVITDGEAFFQTIYSLLSTNAGERQFRPEFQTKLEHLIFGQGDYHDLRVIEESIRDAIRAIGSGVLRDVKVQVKPIPRTREVELLLNLDLIGLYPIQRRLVLGSNAEKLEG